MANNNEFVLLPVNEPTFGTKRKSQIQNYIEHNNGSGVQHIALKTSNIFHTVRAMRERSEFGGFGFMPKPSAQYYEKVPARIGKDTLSVVELNELQELGILADKDDQVTDYIYVLMLMQVFTPSSPSGGSIAVIHTSRWRQTHSLFGNYPAYWL